METIGVIILAAGSSSRLGKPKQLLIYNGQTLLKHAINTALQVHPLAIIVVMGANAQLLKEDMQAMPVQTVENKQWEEGMASSIRCGLSSLLQSLPALDNAIFMVCDQPFISVSLLEDLIVCRKSSSKNIIASTYNNTLGTPVLFNKKYFTELLQLRGNDGAKKIINKYPDDLSATSFPLGYVDIDTIKDYEELLQNTSGLS